MPSLQERIKERRLSCGLTLLQVADKLGIKEATMQRYESGEIRNVKHETIVALSEIFGCSPAYLMGWTDEINEPEVVLHPPITPHEKDVIEAYREHPNMQLAVDRLLGLYSDAPEHVSQDPPTRTIEYAAWGVGPTTATVNVDEETLRAAQEEASRRQADRLMAERDRAAAAKKGFGRKRKK